MMLENALKRPEPAQRPELADGEQRSTEIADDERPSAAR